MTLACIAGLARPDAGCIALEDVPSTTARRHWPATSARAHPGYVMQISALSSPHVGKTSPLACGDEPARKAGDGGSDLERVDFAGYEARRPQYLSGGQRQRVALGGALVTQPR